MSCFCLQDPEKGPAPTFQPFQRSVSADDNLQEVVGPEALPERLGIEGTGGPTYQLHEWSQPLLVSLAVIQTSPEEIFIREVESQVTWCGVTEVWGRGGGVASAGLWEEEGEGPL